MPLADLPIGPVADLPLFDPTRGTSAGRELLAAAGAHPSTSPHQPGPYNPGATAVAHKILSMKFVEMSEITLDDPPPTGRPTPTRLPITDISVWVERFCAIP